jgi:transposase InsO family protein
MKYRYIKEHHGAFRVRKMCRAVQVSESGYYRWCGKGHSRRVRENEQLLLKIRQIHRMSKQRYGSPRITEELREEGYRYNKKRIARLMRVGNIAGKTKRRFKVTTKSKHSLPVAENLVNRNFTAAGPNQLWASDITYVWTGEGWLYLLAIMDVYSRQIVGWSMSNRLTQDLAIQALRQALWRRKPLPGCIFHSDRGSQYAGEAFRTMLTQYGFRQSMSGAGNCYDNAIMETFFHTLKTELVYFERYETRSEAQTSIFEYIEVFYNRQRRHSSLNYKSPVDFEQLAEVA